MADTDKAEVWVQDLTDRNLFFNRLLNLKLPEAALQRRPNPILKIIYDGDIYTVLPFGYIWDGDGHVVIAPVQAGLVRQIFDLSKQGLSIDKIAKKLEGTATLTNETGWHPSIIRTILKNEQAYRGGVLSNDSSVQLPAILQ